MTNRTWRWYAEILFQIAFLAYGVGALIGSALVSGVEKPAAQPISWEGL